MGRKRLTEEQILERYGTKEQYEKHLEAMRKWYQKHPDRNREYYRQNRRREIDRTLKYRDAHPEYYEKQKQRAHNKIHNDPIARGHNRIRTSSRILADRLGIDRTGKELHHPEPMSRKTFIVLPKKKHRWLHYIMGGRNLNVDLTAIKELLPMLGDVVLVKDGKITKWEDLQ